MLKLADLILNFDGSAGVGVVVGNNVSKLIGWRIASVHCLSLRRLLDTGRFWPSWPFHWAEVNFLPPIFRLTKIKCHQ